MKISLRQTVGPGLLFAGAAVGVSHLVQSTRAGAVYGLSLLFVIVLANIIKYPAFSFGPRYAAVTGQSLLAGYRSQGRWALWTYLLLTIGTMFTVQAAVTMVTAGLVLYALPNFMVPTFLSPFGITILVSVLLLMACSFVLGFGKYQALEKMMRWVVATLTVMTVCATGLVILKTNWSTTPWWPKVWTEDIAVFVAPLAGWMPAPIDLAVWHSLWTLAKKKVTGHEPRPWESLLDFRIGYIGCAVLAVCFLVLGAGVMHGQDQPIQTTAGGFARQIIELYVSGLGEWSRYIIAPCALAVMFSTTITVLDGFPRALESLWKEFSVSHPNKIRQGRASSDGDTSLYWMLLVLQCVGTVVVLGLVRGADFKKLIDIATALAFLTAPIFAWLNHRVMFSVQAEFLPSRWMRLFSGVCVGILAVFAIWWLTL